MTRINFVAKRPAVSQSATAQSRVLVEDRACCYCVHYVPSYHSKTGYDGYCHVVEHAVANYDECSAYTKKVKEE